MSSLKTWKKGDSYDVNHKDFLGVVLWEGKSALDGADIVALASFSSANRKTGNAVQVFIMRQDMKPNDAAKKGLDYSVCGDCPHRPHDGKQGTCYVITYRAPRAVWEAYKRGRYAWFDGDYSIFDGKVIRWGAYGDPSLIPYDIVRQVNDAADHFMGYTHQWKKSFAQEHMACLQASCDSVEDLNMATRRGWGSFTVLPIDMDKGELNHKVITCPASIDSKVQCVDCGMCNGTTGRARKIVIHAHGRSAKDVKWD